jgi:hypothetical protein
MRKLKLNLIIFFLVSAFLSIIPISCNSDINSPRDIKAEYQLIFDSTYNIESTSFSDASDIIELSIGGYIIAGRSYEYDYSAILLRIEDIGKQLWSKTYSNAIRLHSVIETEDKFIVAIGKSQQGLYILKTDQQGNLVWEYYYDFPYDASGSKIIENKSGEYLVIANSTEPNSKAKLICLSSNGTLSWESDIAGNGTVRVYSICENADSTLSLLGTANVYSTNESFLLTLNKNGMELKRVQIDLDLYDLSYSYFESSVHQNSLGYYAGCGGNAFILIDSQGYPLTKSLVPISTDYNGVVVYSLVSNIDDGFLVCGANIISEEDDSTHIIDISSYGAIFLFDVNGNFIKSLDVKHQNSYSEATSIILSKDNSIVFTGLSAQNGIRRIWVKKIKIL